MNTGTKKGQLTIFFIVGLVLVIVFGLLAYVGFSSIETTSGVTPEARNYLSSCVENAVYDYFDSLAEGEYYALLGPSNQKPEDIGLTEPLDDVFGTPLSRYDDTTRSTLFGTRNLTPLCDPQGPNSRLQTENQHCFRDSYGSNSHQEQLTQKIEEDLITCQNSAVDEELGTRISQWTNPEVSVTFGKSAVIVDAEYENEQETHTLDLAYTSRLLQLYSFIEERLIMTTKDPRITVTDENHAQQSTFYREGFIFSMTQSGNDWKYSFTDLNSKYRGTQLTISFLGEDRPAYEDTNVEGENPPKYDPDTGMVQE